MVSTLRRSSLRYWLRHPWQLALAILGIALGVAVVSAVDLANESAGRAFQLSMDSINGRASHQIIGGPAGLDETVYRRLRVDLGLRTSAPLVEAYGRSGNETLHLIGIDPLADNGIRGHLSASDPDVIRELLTSPNAVLLALPTARRMGLGPGDVFNLQLAGRTHRLKLLGLLDPPDTSPAAIDGLIIGDIATVQVISGQLDRLSWIDLILEDDQAIQQRIIEILPSDAKLVSAASRSRAMNQMTRAFHSNLTAMSLLALLVGLFLIYNTMSFTVVQRRRLLATLRLLGVTREEIFKLILMESLWLGVIASLLGLALGLILAQGLIHLVGRTINDLYFMVTITQLPLSAFSLIKGLALGLLGTLAAALLPTLEAAGISPHAALQRSSLESRSHVLAHRLLLPAVTLAVAGLLLLAAPGDSLTAGFAGLFLLILGISLCMPFLLVILVRHGLRLLANRISIISRMALAGITASLSRTGIAITALMLAVATALGVSIMIESFRSSVTNWLQTTLQADIYVTIPSLGSGRSSAALDPQLVRRIQALPQLRAMTEGRLVTLESDDGLTDVFTLKLSPGIYPRNPLVEGDPDLAWPAFLRGESVLVSEPLAFHRGLHAGDSIELRTDQGPRRFSIAAIYYDYSSDRGEVLMPRNLYDRFFSDRAIGGLSLYLHTDSDLATVMQQLRHLAAENDQQLIIRSNREIRQHALEIFDRTFAITQVLRLLAILVAVIGIFSALMALQLERAREVAILRSTGVTPLQIGQMLALQTGLSGLIAGLFALPTGIILAEVLIQVINKRSFGWSMQTVLPLDQLAGALLLAMAAALLAAIYPGLKMVRAAPARGLQEE